AERSPAAMRQSRTRRRQEPARRKTPAQISMASSTAGRTENAAFSSGFNRPRIPEFHRGRQRDGASRVGVGLPHATFGVDRQNLTIGIPRPALARYGSVGATESKIE